MTFLLAGVFSGVGCILMVAFPRLALAAADKGLSLFLNSVLPSLLPFFICANFMIALGVPAVLGRCFERFFRAVFHAPGASAFVFIISITSGYPMGAKLIGDMGRRGEISAAEGKRMLAFCTTSGPLFMLGTVGAGMLLHSGAGAVIALSHYLAALLNGLLFRVFCDRSERGNRPEAILSNRTAGTGVRAALPLPRTGRLLEAFTSSILSAFQSLGVICGYIVLFTLATDFLDHSGVLAFLGADWQRGVFKGLLEMTVGAQAISESGGLSLTMKCAFCSMLISFGGISIAAQSASMLADFPVSTGYYLCTKLTHGAIAFSLAMLLGPRMLGQAAAETGAFSEGVRSAETHLGNAYSTFFSLKMMAVVLALFFLLSAVQSRADRNAAKPKPRKDKMQ